MSPLREPVTIKTATTDLKGVLYVGEDGLPELRVEQRHPTIPYTRVDTCRPWSLPAAWTVCPLHAAGWGVLYDAWTDIEVVLQHIRDAQREAEAMARPCDDCGEPNPCRCIEALPGEPHNEDAICGLCGEAGADKIPHPVYWPDERKPETTLVHADCENAECKRASDLITGKQREDFLRNL